jgi:triphosphoribosyl-dephospho-CoA synthase
MFEPPHSIGYLAQVACTWEVLARKAGNVCPGREFPDLTVNDFLVSAAAIAPVLARAPHRPLGFTILDCIEETRKVVRTNTNLGIVLLLAPLASVPLGTPLHVGVPQVLDHTTVADARDVYRAIRLANPGGLGKAPQQDVATEPTMNLRKVMALAREYDRIAEQYVTNFRLVLRDSAATQLPACAAGHNNVEKAIVETQLNLLASYMDSHIIRKRDAFVAMDVKDAARHVLRAGGLDTPAGRHAFCTFDGSLRVDNHARNPGTTADLIAAALFVALREQQIPLSMPFVWEEHPFANL